MPPLGMRGKVFSSYATTEITKKKVIWGEDEIPSLSESLLCCLLFTKSTKFTKSTVYCAPFQNVAEKNLLHKHFPSQSLWLVL
jgi:hypothetical protein